MEKYCLLVTDITEYGELRCVAGWDLNRNKMIRPEPAPGEFWASSTVDVRAFFARYAVIEFEANAPAPPTQLPHRTEDRVVVGELKITRILTHQQAIKILAGSASRDLQNLFAGNLQIANSKGFILLDTPCRSLGGIEIDSSSLRIYEDTDWGKKRLRCSLKSGNIHVTPTIPSALVRQTYRQNGEQAVRKLFESAKRLHLRIGLSRVFEGQPDKCYLQVNDIYAIE